MKLYLLTPRRPLPKSNPWHMHYDVYFGHVIRAETETAARLLAATKCGDEGEVAWTDATLSTCTELTADGPAEVILSDFNAG